MMQSNAASPAYPPATFRRGGALFYAMIGIVALGVIGAVAMMMGGGKQEVSASAALVPAAVTSFEIAVTANGELEAANQVELRSELEKTADIVYIIPEGTLVQKGDLLVQLASEAIETELEEEMLRVESARSDLVAADNALEIQKNENDSAFRKAKLDHELKVIEYQKWLEGDDSKRMEELKLGIETSTRDLQRLKDKLERSRELFASDFLSKDDLESDEIAYIRAEAEIRKAELEKMVYEDFERSKQIKKLTSDIEEAEAEIERVERKNASQLASKEADLTNKRRALQIREDRLANLRDQLSKTKVYAPQGGLVVYETSINFRPWDNRGPLQVGTTIRPNELMIILPDTSEMIASVKVHESLAGRIRPGQSATVKIDAVQNRSFEGVVKSVGVLAESGGWRDPNLREYRVKIKIEATPEEAKLLKPSMRTEAQIVLGNVHDALTVPVQAIFNDGPTRFVYVPDGGKFRKEPVLVGRRSDTYAEILAGVEPGQRVLMRQPRENEILSKDIPEQALAALQTRAQELGAAIPGMGGPGEGQRMRRARPGATQEATPASTTDAAQPAAAANDGETTPATDTEVAESDEGAASEAPAVETADATTPVAN